MVSAGPTEYGARGSGPAQAAGGAKSPHTSAAVWGPPLPGSASHNPSIRKNRRDGRDDLLSALTESGFMDQGKNRAKLCKTTNKLS